MQSIDNNISLSGCNMPRVKNAEFDGGLLMSWESMQCKTGYRYITSLTCTERGLDKNATEFKCCKSEKMIGLQFLKVAFLKYN